MMNNIKNNRLIWIVLLMWLCFLAPAHADSKKEGIDVQDIVFSHIQDAYTWHITEWNGKEIAISLPILVKSEERGWDMFLSHHLHHGQAHHNYYIATEGEHAGKVVEKNSRGEEVRPVDLSLTKNVCGLFLSCGILLFVVLRTAHWYKRHPNQVPSGFTGLMEMIISYIQDGVIKESIGKEEYRPFSSYLLTVFFFILINNLIGIIPVFPGGANITGNIAVTAVLAGCTFIAVNLFAIKEYWKEEFVPKSKPEDYKTKVPLEWIEKDLRRVLSRAGISDEAIRVQEIGDYWRQKGKEFLIGKQLDIRLTDFEQINSIIRSVNTWGIESMRIGELKHKDLPMYRKQGKIEALKAAREKASYLVEAMGQQLGEVIRIIEPADNNISRYLPFEAQSNVSMGAAATEQYRVIKLRYEMTARFAIK